MFVVVRGGLMGGERHFMGGAVGRCCIPGVNKARWSQPGLIGADVL